MNLVQNLESNMSKQRRRLENIFRHKSHEIWLKDGDRNTGFFHSSIIMKKRSNLIHVIKEMIFGSQTGIAFVSI